MTDREIFVVWDSIGPGEPLSYWTTEEAARTEAARLQREYVAQVKSGKWPPHMREDFDRFAVEPAVLRGDG